MPSLLNYCLKIFLHIFVALVLELNAKSLSPVTQPSESNFSSLEENSSVKSSVIKKSLKEESSFFNRHGHQVVGYKQHKTAQTKKNRKNAKELGNKLIGGNYWYAGLGFINEDKFGQVAGISISADDEEQGLQGILSLSHSEEKLSGISLINFNGKIDYFSLDTKSYGIHGALRLYDRTFLFDPVVTSVNFLQIGIGYEHLNLELNHRNWFTQSDNNNNSYMALDIIQDWAGSNSGKNIIKKSEVFNFNITLGNEIGIKHLSLLPYINYQVYGGDIDFSSLSYGISLSFFFSDEFIELGVSDGDKTMMSYYLSFGSYF